MLILIIVTFDVPEKIITSKTATPQATSTLTAATSSRARQDCPRNPLTGEPLKIKRSYRVIAAVIDNHKNARPLYGLEKAELVYETEVEGGITRYLAFFNSYENIDKIGPLRSARPFFLDWTSGFSALIIHCGGSPQALSEITMYDIANLNEFYKTEHFWRNNNLRAPHNIFSSSFKINKYLEKNELWGFNVENNEQRFYNKDEHNRISGTPKDKIKIPYKSPHYQVEWRYNKEEGEYIRYLAGDKHISGLGNVIKSKNVIIQHVPASIKDEELRLERKTIGEGEAFICRNGKCQKGYWSKKDRKHRTRYFVKTKKGERKIKLVPGPTWIEIIKPTVDINL